MMDQGASLTSGAANMEEAIILAGKAIGHSLRQISSSTVLAGELILVLSHLLCLYIWWQALRSFDRQEVERYNKVEN